MHTIKKGQARNKHVPGKVADVTHTNRGQAGTYPKYGKAGTLLNNGDTQMVETRTHLWQDQTIRIASIVPMPAARGSPAGPNQWF